jgi:DNA-binding transcriptional MerR regulator
VTQPIRFFSPAETAARLGVTVKALRVYEAHGLVKPVRTSAGWRAYGPDQMARLHQVLALKRLGLPLKDIGDLLAGRLADLDAVLALQEDALRLRKAETEQGLALLARARARLKCGEALSMDDLTQLTRETAMSDNIFSREEWKRVFHPLYDKLFTPEEREAVDARNREEGEHGQAAWGEMMTEAAVAMANRLDPASPEAMDLATRWMALARRFTGGDPGVSMKVSAMWQEAFKDDQFRQRSPVTPQMMAFISEAFKNAVAAGKATFP